jgi:hypothetical protein
LAVIVIFLSVDVMAGGELAALGQEIQQIFSRMKLRFSPRVDLFDSTGEMAPVMLSFRSELDHERPPHDAPSVRQR